MDSLGILFKYGIHLPKILMTGLKAMNSFKKAANFEKQLAHAADRSDLIAPFSKNDIEYLTAQLPREHVNGFIEDSLDLFKTLHDRKLVKRIIDIVNQLIIKMDARPNIYSIEEVQGLKLGRNLIEKGDALFESLTTKEQDILFDMVVDIERDVLDRIFKIQ